MTIDEKLDELLKNQKLIMHALWLKVDDRSHPILANDMHKAITGYGSLDFSGYEELD